MVATEPPNTLGDNDPPSNDKKFDGTHNKRGAPKRKRYCNDKKIQVLEALGASPGSTVTAVATKFGLPEGTVRGWCKERDKILLAASKQHRGSFKANPNNNLNKVMDHVVQFYNLNQQKPEPERVPITFDVLVEAALQAKDRILQRHTQKPYLTPKECEAIARFKASKAWAVNFCKKRHWKTAYAQDQDENPNPQKKRRGRPPKKAQQDQLVIHYSDDDKEEHARPGASDEEDYDDDDPPPTRHLNAHRQLTEDEVYRLRQQLLQMAEEFEQIPVPRTAALYADIAETLRDVSDLMQIRRKREMKHLKRQAAQAQAALDAALGKTDAASGPAAANGVPVWCPSQSSRGSG